MIVESMKPRIVALTSSGSLLMSTNMGILKCNAHPPIKFNSNRYRSERTRETHLRRLANSLPSLEPFRSMSVKHLSAMNMSKLVLSLRLASNGRNSKLICFNGTIYFFSYNKTTNICRHRKANKTKTKRNYYLLERLLTWVCTSRSAADFCARSSRSLGPFGRGPWQWDTARAACDLPGAASEAKDLHFDKETYKNKISN